MEEWVIIGDDWTDTDSSKKSLSVKEARKAIPRKWWVCEKQRSTRKGTTAVCNGLITDYTVEWWENTVISLWNSL